MGKMDFQSWKWAVSAGRRQEYFDTDKKRINLYAECLGMWWMLSTREDTFHANEDIYKNDWLGMLNIAFEALC